MLVLSRKQDERIRIGDDIQIVIVKAMDGHGQVRIGIEAPANVAVHREEVWQAIRRESPPGNSDKVTG